MRKEAEMTAWSERLTGPGERRSSTKSGYPSRFEWTVRAGVSEVRGHVGEWVSTLHRDDEPVRGRGPVGGELRRAGLRRPDAATGCAD